MADRLIGVDSADPKLPLVVIDATGASGVEMEAGTATDVFVTPAGVSDAVDRMAIIADTARFATLQDAVDLADVNGGGRVHVHQTWTLTASLTLPSNVHLDLGRSGVIRRGWSATIPVPQANKYTGALIRQESTDPLNPNTGITISGGRLEANGFDGPTIAMYYADDLTLRDIDIDYTGAGDWCVTVAGERFNISNVNPRGGATIFEDGIHIVGGSGTINGCHIESGDDMVALTTFSGGPGTIQDVTVSGITGSSQEGHLFRIDVSAGGFAVDNVSFAAGAAHAGVARNGGIMLLNATGTRSNIRNVSISGAVLRTGNTATVNPRGVYLDCVQDVTLTGIIGHDFLWEQLYVDDADGLIVNGCILTGAASSTFPVARVINSGTVSILGSIMRVGASGTGSPLRHLSVENLIVHDCGLLNVPNNSQAVYTDTGNTTLNVDGCWSTLAGSAGHGIRILGSLTKLVLGQNDFAITGGHELYPANLPSKIKVTSENYDAERSGAVLDGIADDTAALNAARSVVAAAGGGVMYLRGTAAVTGTVTLSGGVILRGPGGNGANAKAIISSALSGPVIHITERSCGVKNIAIKATAGRRAASTSTGHGIRIAGSDVAPASYPSLSRQCIEDVAIFDQPTDGIHAIGSLEHSRFSLVTVYDCVRHGFVHDGGTVAGYTNLQIPAFILSLDKCRALECGGQALILQSSGGNAPFGVTFNQFEALGCAWDSTKRYGGSLYQVIIDGGVGITFDTPDIEDQQYANTTTTVGGHARTGLATPAKGIYRAGDGTILRHPFFSSLAESYNQVSGTGLDIKFPRIFAGTYPTLQNPAIIIASGVKDAEVRWSAASTSGATQVVRNQSVNARIVADGIPQIGDAFTAFDIADGLAPIAGTIATGVLTTTARRTTVGGEGAAADDLATIRRASGINGTTGEDVLLFRGSQDITVKHGTGNIKTATATDVVMTSTANTVLQFAYDGTNWVQI